MKYEPLNACTTGYVAPLARALSNLGLNLARVGLNADRIARGFKPLNFGGKIVRFTPSR